MPKYFFKILSNVMHTFLNSKKFIPHWSFRRDCLRVSLGQILRNLPVPFDFPFLNLLNPELKRLNPLEP